MKPRTLDNFKRLSRLGEQEGRRRDQVMCPLNKSQPRIARISSSKDRRLLKSLKESIQRPSLELKSHAGNAISSL
jgi:hypothetical protein